MVVVRGQAEEEAFADAPSRRGMGTPGEPTQLDGLARRLDDPPTPTCVRHNRSALGYITGLVGFAARAVQASARGGRTVSPHPAPQLRSPRAAGRPTYVVRRPLRPLIAASPDLR